MTLPSEASKIAFTCFSPTINDLTILRFSNKNLGSGLPDPNGDKESIYKR
jgi:hypothetical protein